MKVHVPVIGDRMELTKDWTFPLHHEYRNDKLFKAFGLTMEKGWNTNAKPPQVTLKKGTVLKLDRLYVRKGAGTFSSLTFIIDGGCEEKLTKARFWAKVDACNNIQFQEPQDHVARTVSVHWGYLPQHTNLKTGILKTSFSDQPRPLGKIYGEADQWNSGKKLFEVEQIIETRPATKEEILEWHKRWKKHLWLQEAIFPPKEMVYTTYNKLHLKHIASGKVIGKYTSVDSLKARARSYANKILQKEHEANLFNQ